MEELVTAGIELMNRNVEYLLYFGTPCSMHLDCQLSDVFRQKICKMLLSVGPLPLSYFLLCYHNTKLIVST